MKEVPNSSRVLLLFGFKTKTENKHRSCPKPGYKALTNSDDGIEEVNSTMRECDSVLAITIIWVRGGCLPA